MPAELRDTRRSIFDVIRDRDMLVHHPFDSFTASVERFLEEAAHDEQVLAIKLTLYRTSGDTALVARAGGSGAARQAGRGDRGAQGAVRRGEQHRLGAHSSRTPASTSRSGSPALKTHAKMALVVRRETDGIRRYVHFGSGNYNSRTARLYTDIGLFTCSPSIGADVSDLFNSLTGYSRQQLYRKLLVAPVEPARRDSSS